MPQQLHKIHSEILSQDWPYNTYELKGAYATHSSHINLPNHHMAKRTTLASQNAFVDNVDAVVDDIRILETCTTVVARV